MKFIQVIYPENNEPALINAENITSVEILKDKENNIIGSIINDCYDNEYTTKESIIEVFKMLRE